MRRDVRRDLCRYRLAVCTKVGSLFRDHVHASEWRIGLRLSPAQQHRSYGRIAVPLLKADHGRSVGCASDGADARIGDFIPVLQKLAAMETTKNSRFARFSEQLNFG